MNLTNIDDKYVMKIHEIEWLMEFEQTEFNEMRDWVISKGCVVYVDFNNKVYGGITLKFQTYEDRTEFIFRYC